MLHFCFLLASLPWIVFAAQSSIHLGDKGSINYTYVDDCLTRVDRVATDGSILYTHVYHYNDQGKLISEDLIGGLGTIEYFSDGSAISPYSYEKCVLNDSQQIIQHYVDDTLNEYSYDERNRLIYDCNDEDYAYDENGYLSICSDFRYTYDDSGNLVKVDSPDIEACFTYDDEGRRIRSVINGVTQYYEFLGLNEIAILNENGTVKELRAPGLTFHKDVVKAVAIETEEGMFCPIYNVHGHLVKLIDIESKEVFCIKKCDPYGKGLSQNAKTSWVFSYKHYDPKLNLIYFGNRFYNPAIRKWLTPDPAMQTSDPFQYCLENPVSYFDPDGCAAIAVPLVSYGAGGWSLSLLNPATATGALVLGLGYGAYKGYE